jgi:hypothetical protein
MPPENTDQVHGKSSSFFFGLCGLCFCNEPNRMLPASGTLYSSRRPWKLGLETRDLGISSEWLFGIHERKGCRFLHQHWYVSVWYRSPSLLLPKKNTRLFLGGSSLVTVVVCIQMCEVKELGSRMCWRLRVASLETNCHFLPSSLILRLLPAGLLVGSIADFEIVRQSIESIGALRQTAKLVPINEFIIFCFIIIYLGLMKKRDEKMRHEGKMIE